MWRLALQKKGNRRRLWRLAVATQPRTQANEVIVDWALCYGSHAATKGSRLSMSCGFRGAGPISWNPLQAAKQRSCGYNMIPHPYRSPKGDWRIHYDVEDYSRSRFAEPKEGEVMPIPQLRSFGACSGFLKDTCPLGTRRWLVVLLW